MDRKGREIMMESEASRHAEENKKLVGNNIAALRKKQKLTKGFLCDMATISKPTLNGIESGKGNATISTLTKVADALGVTVGDLFNPLSDKQERVAVGRQRKPRTKESRRQAASRAAP